MATAAVTPYISVEEYLHTAYEPDVDYIDGHIEERNVGEYDHGTLMAVITEILRRHRREWGIRVPLDTRTQVSPSRFRIPDVSVTSASVPKEQIVRTPPMLCIEILSPEDTLKKMLKRCDDYFAMGVPAVWIFDPQKRTVHIRAENVDTTHKTGMIYLDNTLVSLNLNEVWSALDED